MLNYIKARNVCELAFTSISTIFQSYHDDVCLDVAGNTMLTDTVLLQWNTMSQTPVIWARSCENVSYAICEQQRRRSACASTQSEQHLCCLPLREYDMYTCYIQSFKIVASFCSWAGCFGPYLVKCPGRHIFARCGSYYPDIYSNSTCLSSNLGIWAPRNYNFLDLGFTASQDYFTHFQPSQS